MTTVSDRPHALYRFYDNDRQLLYVGITSNPGARWKKHANDKPWWGDVARVELEHYPTRDAVLAAERDAIISERPQRNVVHNRPGRGLPALVAADMPDDCHDVCAPTGLCGVYFPHRWHDGIAHYRCINGHTWTCHWRPGTGSAPEHAGVPASLVDLRGEVA